jgi:hypothetical protein
MLTCLKRHGFKMCRRGKLTRKRTGNRDRLMRYHPFQHNIVFTVFFSILMALSLNACSDTNNASGPAPLSPDAQLSSLTVTPGTLQPAFSGDVQSYTVDVTSNVASVTVTAQPQNAGATVSINGQTTTSRSVSLGAPGSSTSLTIVVTGPNGSQNIYLVTVNRAALAGNNSLQSVTVSPGTLAPEFNENTLNYFVNVASTVGNVSVKATLQETHASMTVNGQGTPSGQARTITLNGAGSSTPITIIVTAQNGTQKTYSVVVQRAAFGGNNNLQSLTVSPGTFFPAFNASTTSYFVNVDSTVGNVSVKATLQDAHASMTVNGQGTPSGQARTIPLNGAGASTPITIIVTAPNGASKPYSVAVQRAAVGGNNDLQNLTVSPGTFFPAFNASTTSYFVNVDSTVANVSVKATLQDANASMTVNGHGTSSGQARTIPLNGAGSNTPITIIVTAQNGVSKPYSVAVQRAAVGANNNLQSLTVSPGAFFPAFNGSTTSDFVNVDSHVAGVTVTAQAQDAGATVSINGQTTMTGLFVTLEPAGTPTIIPIIVTAPNGAQKTSSVTVNRSASVLSGNNNLSALVVSAGALVPPFVATTMNYDVTAPHTTADTTVTATVEDSTATLTIHGSPATSGVPSPSMTLAVGLNSIPIVVTAENGTTKTYTVVVTQEPPAP